ncbi:MAG TPA: nicotinate-nucleotide adenylyltransferase [Miltoncostaeaceae bacterium]|nr:nicotinate-nucleotide adenylyltransferase [Miltoncostaeaceae bacterium]
MLGGTFDPPHIGHLIVASEALWRLELDVVRLVPARTPPHKPAGAQTGGDRRAAWLEAAVAGAPGLEVSRIELERGGPSYTADTLEAMAAAEPGALLWFILGADQLAGLLGWRDPERILAVARLAVVPRAGHDVRALAERVAPGRADLIDVPEIGVSSSMIRDRIARGLPIRFLVPPAVEESLRREGLVASPEPVPDRKDPSRPRSS